MKLRISGNSIRLRLSQSDVSLLVKEGQIVEKLDFPKPSYTFEYQLSVLKNSDVSHVLFDGQKMIFEIPQQDIVDWANSNQEGIYKTINTEKNESLDLHIEKDYECLHKENETTDTFPNPKEDGR